jgi:hypothetical protein
LISLSQSPFRPNPKVQTGLTVRPTRFSNICAADQVSIRNPATPPASKAVQSAGCLTCRCSRRAALAPESMGTRKNFQTGRRRFCRRTQVRFPKPLPSTDSSTLRDGRASALLRLFPGPNLNDGYSQSSRSERV